MEGEGSLLGPSHARSVFTHLAPAGVATQSKLSVGETWYILDSEWYGHWVNYLGLNPDTLDIGAGKGPLPG